MRFEISAYAGFAPKNYAPNIRFSDGGANLYMGFFHGEAIDVKGIRELEIKTTIQGLPGETLIAPTNDNNSNKNSDEADYAYAYFGPQKPVLSGKVQMIIDPAMPVWLRDLIVNTSAISARYFEETYQRKLSRQLSLSAAVSDLETNGFSLKGGASNGQINYRLSGKLLLSEDPVIQAKLIKFANLVAFHEMAHIWQNDVTKGGIGENAAWIHEGGAEVMAADGLLKTGLWSQLDFDTFIEKPCSNVIP